MSDSDNTRQWDNRHHRRSRSRSPVSAVYTGETLAEREQRRLAEAVVPVGPPAKQPQAAPNDPESPDQEPVPAREAAPAAQSAALPPRPRRSPLDAQGAETASPASRATAPSTLLARGSSPTRAPSASP